MTLIAEGTHAGHTVVVFHDPDADTYRVRHYNHAQQLKQLHTFPTKRAALEAAADMLYPLPWR